MACAKRRYDRTKLALRLEDIYRARAKEAQGTRTDLLPTLAKSPAPIDTREEVARIAGGCVVQSIWPFFLM
jgi:hypothetical protein